MPLPTIALRGVVRAVLAAASGGVALAMMVRFIYLPLVGAIADRQAAVTELRVKIADAYLLTERLADRERLLQQLKQQDERLRRRFGESPSVAGILEMLSQQAHAHQLELVSVQARADGEQPRVVTLGPRLSLREVPLALELRGRYRPLGEFLGWLAEAPFFALVHELRLTKLTAPEQALQEELLIGLYLSEPQGP